MARRVVVLALILLAVFQAYAADQPKVDPAAVTNSDADLAEPPTGGAIGVLEAADAPSIVRAAPIGGPVPPGAFDAHSSDGSTLQLSAVAGVAAVAGFFYF